MSISVLSVLGQASAKPTKVVTGQRLAKATHYPKWERALDAALWLRGEVQVLPTTKDAAEFFGISVSLIAAAGRQHDEHTKLNGSGNGAAVPALSDAVIDNMIAEIGPDRFWAALDRYTAPQLPLMAGE
jgi:hypothetical protein